MAKRKTDIDKLIEWFYIEPGIKPDYEDFNAFNEALPEHIKDLAFHIMLAGKEPEFKRVVDGLPQDRKFRKALSCLADMMITIWAMREKKLDQIDPQLLPAGNNKENHAAKFVTTQPGQIRRKSAE